MDGNCAHTAELNLPSRDAAERWRSLADLFAAQALASPTKIAILSDDEAVTYSDLAGRVNRMARLLMARGVAPDTITAIVLDRSVALLVAVMGVLAAGGAYMPIDAEAPETRRRSVVSDSGATLMLSASGHGVDGAALGIETLLVDDPQVIEAMAALSGAPIEDGERLAELQPNHLSYIISTSGTTGTPKCSGNTQGGIVNCLQWLTAEMALGADERVLQQTAFSFDMAVLEMFLPLI